MLSHYNPLILGHVSIFSDQTHEARYKKNRRIF